MPRFLLNLAEPNGWNDVGKILLHQFFKWRKPTFLPKIYLGSIAEPGRSHIFPNHLLPVGWGCKIHRQHLCRRVRHSPNECSGGEVPVMLELWGMRPRVVAPDRAQSMGKIELNCVLMLNWITWNRTVLTFNCVGTKSILILNWIFWNRTVWINWIAWNRNVFDN